MGFASFALLKEVGSLVKEVMAVWENVKSHRKNGKKLSDFVNIVYKAIENRCSQGNDIEGLAIDQFRSIMKRAIAVAEKCNKSALYRAMFATEISANLIQIQDDLNTVLMIFLTVRETERGGQPPSPSPNTDLLTEDDDEEDSDVRWFGAAALNNPEYIGPFLQRVLLTHRFADPDAEKEEFKRELKEDELRAESNEKEKKNLRSMIKQIDAFNFYEANRGSGRRYGEFSSSLQSPNPGSGTSSQYNVSREKLPTESTQAELGSLLQNLQIGQYDEGREKGPTYLKQESFLFQNSSVDGDKAAAYHRAPIYAESSNGNIAHRYKAAAYKDSPQALCASGLRYKEDRNFDKAVELFRMAAEKGDPCGQFNLGLCYELGEGVYSDLEKATKWYELAAEQKCASALVQLGHIFEDRSFVHSDVEKAKCFFKKAAYLGDPNGQFHLGRCYDEGIGTERNEQKAIELYKMARNQGCDKSKYKLIHKGYEDRALNSEHKYIW